MYFTLNSFLFDELVRINQFSGLSGAGLTKFDCSRKTQDDSQFAEAGAS